MSVRTRRNSKIEKTEVVEVAENTEEVMDEDYVKCAECGDLLSSKIEDEDVERETNNNVKYVFVGFMLNVLVSVMLNTSY